MIRRFKFVSSFFIASAISLASSLVAQAAPTTANINYSGTVPSTCTFTNIQNGTLAPNAAETALGSKTASYPGGTPGSFTINCNGAAILTVADPIPSGTNPVATINNKAEMTGTNLPNTVGSPSGLGGNASVAAGFNDTISVNMEASSPSGKLLGGTYTYTVTVTATPN